MNHDEIAREPWRRHVEGDRRDDSTSRRHCARIDSTRFDRHHSALGGDVSARFGVCETREDNLSRPKVIALDLARGGIDDADERRDVGRVDPALRRPRLVVIR